MHISSQIARVLADVGESDRVRVGIAVAAGADRAPVGAHRGRRSGRGARGARRRYFTRSSVSARRDDRPDRLAADPAARHHAAHQRARGASGRPPDARRDRLGRPIDVVMAFIRRSGIARCSTRCGSTARPAGRLRVLTTTYTGSTEEPPSTSCAAIGAEVRVSYDIDHDPAARQGLAVSPQVGVLDRVHRLVEPDALRAGRRASSGTCGSPAPATRRRRQVRRGLRELLGRAATSSRTTPDEFVSETASAVARRAARSCPQPDRAAARAVPGAPARADRARPRSAATTATCSSRRPAPARRSWRRSTTRGCASSCPAPGCSSSRTARRSWSRASPRSATRCATPAFGELWVGGARPTHFEHVFASIQSLQRRGLDDLAPDHFDVVIVDEFHHAAAPSYRGCSTTSSRWSCSASPRPRSAATGCPLLALVRRSHRRRAAALGRDRPAPPLARSPTSASTTASTCATIPWRRGRGYDVEGLTSAYTSNDVWARQV